MTNFRDRHWNDRLTGMGDQAEAIFERECKTVIGVGFVRYGLNRPPIQVGKLPLKLRYTPDYLTTKGLVEVQGFGRDQTMKLKFEKWDALCQWEYDAEVFLFVYDSANERHKLLTLGQVDALLQDAETREFPEGKGYWAIDAEDIFDVA